MMPRKKRNTMPRKKKDDGSERIAQFAEAAIDAFKKDCAAPFRKLVKQFSGNAAAVGVFGVGSCVVAVQRGKVQVNPRSLGRSGLTARGATYPETIAALAEGKLTVLDAFHKGDLVMQSVKSEQLHEAYTAFVEHADAALRSKRVQRVITDFRKFLGA